MNNDFSAGLDDLDDEDDKKKGGQGKESSKQEAEEEKEGRKLTGVKPTFRGRMNLKGTGDTADGENSGVVKDYNFGVKFKPAQGENTQGGEKRTENRNVDRKDNRQPRDKGMSLNAFNNKNVDDEEGFEIVGRDTRKQKKAKRDDSSSGEEDAPSGGFKRNTGEKIRGARVERGGTRGGRGG